MPSAPQAASLPSQPTSSTRMFGDVVDQVLRFVQQPSSHLKGSNANYAGRNSFESSSGYCAAGPPSPNGDGDRRTGAWYADAHEHEAQSQSPLSPSRTLVASTSGSSTSASSTPKSRYRVLRRSDSAASTSSSTSTSRGTEKPSGQAKRTGGRNGRAKDADSNSKKPAEEQAKRVGVSERLRRLGRKMQAQKASLSSPKVSGGELVDDLESIRPSPKAYASSSSSARAAAHSQPTTTSRSSSAKGKGKQRQHPQHAPAAHAKLLSMVAEADEPHSTASSVFLPTSSASPSSAPNPNPNSSRTHPGTTTPTAVQTPTSSSSSPTSNSKKVLPPVPTTPTGSSRHEENPPKVPTNTNEPPEPTTLAARIQALIFGLPVPSLSFSASPASRADVGPSVPESPSPSSSTSGTLTLLPPSPVPPTPIPLSFTPLPFSPSLPLSSSPLPPSPSVLSLSLPYETDASGRPIPPPSAYASPLPPRERMLLEEMLSSPVIMNGELELPEDKEEDVGTRARDTSGVDVEREKQKPMAAQASRPMRSIWSVLESMGTGFGKASAQSPQSASPVPLPTSPQPANADLRLPAYGSQNANANADHHDHANETESIYSDAGSSVMIYSPLIPSGAQDLPELAEVAPVFSGDPGFEAQDATASGNASAGAGVNGEAEAASSWIPSAVRQWSIVQAISGWSAASPAGEGGAVSNVILSSSSVSMTTSTTTEASGGSGGSQPPVNPAPAPPIPPVRKAWVPSTTKMSVQAMWWGYRLYLPPPVMAILSDRTLEASKRAALITTALTWFFTNLPITALPPPLQPAALLLQRIVPFLGYIGAFISWSWGVIQGYDVGYGVTLTATWLLPVALIPGTWHKDEFPVSPRALGQTVPLPQMVLSPVPSSHRTLDEEPVPMLRMVDGRLVPARVTEFLPLPSPPTTSAQLASTSTPTPATATIPLPPSPIGSTSTATPVLQQFSPPTTPTPLPPTPISPIRTPRASREAQLPPSTPQMTANTFPPSATVTPSSHYQTPLSFSPAPSSASHYQTPLLASPAATSSSLYQTPLSSPRAPMSPHLSSSPTQSTPRVYQAMEIPSSPPSSSSHSQRRPPSKSSSSIPLSQSHPSPTQARPHAKATSISSSKPQHEHAVTHVASSLHHPQSHSSSSSQFTPPSSATRRSSSRKPTSANTTTTASHLVSQHTVPAPPSVPVGSHLEQHLLSGPLMSPIPLPEVDLPASSPVASPAHIHSPPLMASQAPSSGPVPMYTNRDERDRERDRDRARIRDRARAIFRRDSNSAGAQKPRAK